MYLKIGDCNYSVIICNYITGYNYSVPHGDQKLTRLTYLYARREQASPLQGNLHVEAHAQGNLQVEVCAKGAYNL